VSARQDLQGPAQSAPAPDECTTSAPANDSNTP
jgi:hypothetical protein